jgi:Terminase RNaseH-like domain
MTGRIELPALHRAQKNVVDHCTRFTVLCTGRRWGKTVLGLHMILQYALAGEICGWFSPSYRHLAAVWRDLERIIGPIAESNKNERHWKLPGGGEIEFWSLDTDAVARSRRYRFIVVDEAAYASDLRTQWPEALRPTLSDSRGGALFCSSPNGLNYFAQLFGYGADPDRDEWTSFQCPTSDNPMISSDEIESAKGDMSSLSFLQEYMGEFCSTEGQIFRRIEDALYTVPTELLPAPGDYRQYLTTNRRMYCLGVDWGRTTDATCIVVSCQDGSLSDPDENGNRVEMTYIVHVERYRNLEYALQLQRLNLVYEKYGRPVVLAEANSIGQPLLEMLHRAGMRNLQGFQTTNSSKANAIDALSLAFDRGAIKVPDNPVLLAELRDFQSTKLPSGLSRYSASAGNHDDAVIALMLAFHGIQKYAARYDPVRRAERNAVLMAAFYGV